MRYTYKTHGTCSRSISFDINGDIVSDISFDGGCNGNLKAVSTLVDGMTVDQIEKKLSGIECGYKGTSCGDQLAHTKRPAAGKRRMSEPDGKGKSYDALKLGSQLCFPLYAAARETVKKYTPYLSELGLTYTQYIVMMVLWEEKSVSAKRLGERLLLDSGTLTPLLKTLEKRGLLSRSRDGRTRDISASSSPTPVPPSGSVRSVSRKR